MTQIPGTQSPHLDQPDSFDLDSLVSGAVRLRGDRAALADSTNLAAPISFAEFDRRVSTLAGCWLDLGIEPGERIMVAAGATATSVIAIVAAMRAGLDLALAPLHLSGEELVEFAGDCDAVALAADVAHGELAPAEELLTVASQAPRVRLVCSLGGGQIDGAVDADPARLAETERRSLAVRRQEPRILTRAPNGEIVIHRQRTLVAAALDLVTRARIGMRRPIVTTIAPVTFAGLVVGPVAALLAGAPLRLHGPFAAAEFSALLRRNGPAHLVAPGALLPALRKAGLLEAKALASLLLVSRYADLGEALACDRPAAGTARETVPVVDILAIGEQAAVPEPRDEGGNPLPPLAAPHYISLDDRRILAVGRGADFSLEGAAVTEAGQVLAERAPM